MRRWAASRARFACRILARQATERLALCAQCLRPSSPCPRSPDWLAARAELACSHHRVASGAMRTRSCAERALMAVLSAQGLPHSGAPPQMPRAQRGLPQKRGIPGVKRVIAVSSAKGKLRLRYVLAKGVRRRWQEHGRRQPGHRTAATRGSQRVTATRRSPRSGRLRTQRTQADGSRGSGRAGSDAMSVQLTHAR